VEGREASWTIGSSADGTRRARVPDPLRSLPVDHGRPGAGLLLLCCSALPRGSQLEEDLVHPGELIITIDAREVHDAMQHLTYPRNRAVERRFQGLGGGAGMKLRVAEFLANLWHGPG
jgi:hypothetical protein